jgi:hypothetical protein
MPVGSAVEMLGQLAAEYGLDGVHVRNLGSSLRGVFVRQDSVSVAILNETLDEQAQRDTIARLMEQANITGNVALTD